MKIKYSKNYSLVREIYEIDRRAAYRYQYHTQLSDYSGTWETADVTIEELQEYIKKGYAIKINC